MTRSLPDAPAAEGDLPDDTAKRLLSLDNSMNSGQNVRRNCRWMKDDRRCVNPYYNPSERCFSCLIFEAIQHKSRKSRGLCLSPRRQDRKGEQQCDPVFLAFFASWRENWFWLRPEAAMGNPCLNHSVAGELKVSGVRYLCSAWSRDSLLEESLSPLSWLLIAGNTLPAP
jgi:hypothetical protein